MGFKEGPNKYKFPPVSPGCLLPLDYFTQAHCNTAVASQQLWARQGQKHMESRKFQMVDSLQDFYCTSLNWCSRVSPHIPILALSEKQLTLMGYRAGAELFVVYNPGLNGHYDVKTHLLHNQLPFFFCCFYHLSSNLLILVDFLQAILVYSFLSLNLFTQIYFFPGFSVSVITASGSHTQPCTSIVSIAFSPLHC